LIIEGLELRSTSKGFFRGSAVPFPLSSKGPALLSFPVGRDDLGRSSRRFFSPRSLAIFYVGLKVRALFLQESLGTLAEISFFLPSFLSVEEDGVFFFGRETVLLDKQLTFPFCD